RESPPRLPDLRVGRGADIPALAVCLRLDHKSVFPLPAHWRWSLHCRRRARHYNSLATPRRFGSDLPPVRRTPPRVKAMRRQRVEVIAVEESVARWAVARPKNSPSSVERYQPAARSSVPRSTFPPASK